MTDRPPSLLAHLRSTLREGVGWVLAFVCIGLVMAIPGALGLPSAAYLFPFAFALVLVWAMVNLRTHPANAFGRRRRVEYAVARGGVCGECRTPIDVGEKRRYVEQVVAFGVPLRTLDWGLNRYCVDCREDEGSGGGPASDPPARARGDDRELA